MPPINNLKMTWRLFFLIDNYAPRGYYLSYPILFFNNSYHYFEKTVEMKGEPNVKQKIIIVGGVAGGASTATRLRRLNEEAEIILFEKGQYISFANCGLPYYIGGTIAERAD